MLIFGACKSHKNLTAATMVKPQLVIRLQTTVCYGTCPAYIVEIFDNDSLSYTGEKFVAKEGNISKKLPKGTVNQLVEKFRGANFFKFQNQYTAQITDFPTTYLSFTDNGNTKKVMDYYNAPDSLKKLEGLVSDLVKEEVTVKNER